MTINEHADRYLKCNVKFKVFFLQVYMSLLVSLFHNHSAYTVYRFECYMNGWKKIAYRYGGTALKISKLLYIRT